MTQKFETDTIVAAGLLRCRIEAATPPERPPLRHCWSYYVTVLGWLDQTRTDECPEDGLSAWLDEPALTLIAD